jgi:4'-phosphopantetheinyl transferase
VVSLTSSADLLPAYSSALLDVPRLRAEDVRVLRVDFHFAATLASPSLAVLSDDERAAAQRFMRHEDKLRSAATRAALRIEVGRAVNRAPEHLHIERDALGRPCLVGSDYAEDFDAIDFNVSHSGSHALIAFSAFRRVGVDIEQHIADFDWRPMGAFAFNTRDAAMVARLPEAERHRAFYDIWTAKEALVKALGVGVTRGMTGFSVLGDGAQAAARCVALDAGMGSACHPACHPYPGHDAQPVVRLDDDLVDDPALRHLPRFDCAWIRVARDYSACIAWSRVARLSNGGAARS